MTASRTKKYRSTDYVKKKIKELNGLNNYIKKISPGTARNYKKIIETLIEKEVDSVQLRRQLNKKINSSISNENIEDNINTIIERIKKRSDNFNEIRIKEDYVFLLILLFAHLQNKEMENLKKSAIISFENNENIEVHICDEKKVQKFIVMKYVDLYKKVFKTMNKYDDNELIFDDFKSNYLLENIRNQFIKASLSFEGGVKTIKNISITKIVTKII